MEKIEIIFATHNEDKLKEIREYFKDTRYEIISPSDMGIKLNTVEDGGSFEANAIKKARAIGEVVDNIVIADDSGLSIDYLNGEPGVDSAIYLGAKTSYKKRLNHILKKMKNAPTHARAASFVCVMAIYAPEKDEMHTVRGELRGSISQVPQGKDGFGYDPIFYVPKYNLTTAQMDVKLKNSISHRGKALDLVIKRLYEMA